MQLTRMNLNPHRRGTRHLVSSPQRMHAAVLTGFPPGSHTETPEGRVLWRLDRGRNDSLTLYISSPSRPDLAHVVEQAGWPTTSDPWQSASLDSLLERLETGQRWAFRLTANPVRSQSQGEGKRGKRFAHVTAAQQEQWLVDHSDGWGFSVLEGQRRTVGVTSRDTVSFARNSERQRHQVTIGRAVFDGTLSVTSPEALRTAMGRGLGRAKGYGCGLLTLAPVR